MGIERFVIEAAEVESMAKESGISVLQLLPSLVDSTQKLARPPISNYHVGAVGLGSSGRIFLGVNLEFPGLPLHHSVHAEQFLITNAAINGETQLMYIAVSQAPCGHCRQFMQEMRGATELTILITAIEEEEDRIYRPISYFLPHHFGPHNLLDKSVPLLLEPRHNGLVFNDDDGVLCNGYDSNSRNSRADGGEDLCNGNLNSTHDDEMLEKKLKNAALEAANISHAPYSGCPSGIALADCDGKIYKGLYTESAAYNPSLGPVQGALVAYVAGGGGEYGKIVAGVLVEKEGVMVRQEDTARLLLKSVAPRCDFQVFNCTSAKE